jgi:cytochrome c
MHSMSAAAAALVVVALLYVVSGFGQTYVVSGFSRTFEVRLKADTPYAQATRSVKSGVYTVDQARRGREHYRKRCVLCHLDNGQGRGAEPEIVGQSLEREGDAEAPAIAGAEFLKKWSGQDARALYDKMASTMPPGGAGSLSAQEYTDVLAYLFELSKLPTGQQDLPVAKDQLELIRIEP